MHFSLISSLTSSRILQFLNEFDWFCNTSSTLGCLFEMQQSFHRELLMVVPVKAMCTVACVCKQRWLAFNQGSNLHLTCLSTCDDFHVLSALGTVGQDVHGIECCASLLVAFGGRYFCLTRFECSDLSDAKHSFDSPVNVQTCADWTLACHVVSLSTTHYEVIFLLAHNCIELWSIDFGSSDVPPALVRLQSIQCVENSLLYCGQLSGASKSELHVVAGTFFSEILVWMPFRSAEVWHRITDHRGCAFSLHLSQQRLFATADDRSVRVWLGTLESTEPPVSERVFFGHEGRVWDTAFVHENCLVSAGEDGYVCEWNIMSGKLVRRVSCNMGSIRRLCFDEQSYNLFAASDSGAIVRLDLNAVSANYAVSKYNVVELPIQDGEPVTTVAYVDDIVYCVTKMGKVFSSRNSRQEIILVDSFLNYCCVSTSLRCLALGGLAGTVHILSAFGDRIAIAEYKALEGKVFNLHWLKESKLLVCGVDGMLKFLDVQFEHKCTELFSLILPTGKQRWTSAAQLLNNTLFVGDRNGSIFVYNLASNEASTDLEPCEKWLKVHRSHGVTDLHVDTERQCLLSLGRDGMLRRWKILLGRALPGLQLVAENVLAQSLEWPAKFLFFDTLGMCIGGFSAGKFTILCLHTKRVFCSVECGGGHRSWTLATYPPGNCAKFYFVKDGQLVSTVVSLNDIQTVRQHVSIQRINCITQFVAAGADYLIFGGEDGQITVTQLLDNGIVVCQRIKAHVSSVHCMSQLERTGLLLSGGGRSEIFGWRFDDSLIEFLQVAAWKDTVCDARIMSLQCWTAQSAEFVLAARSDGRLQVFHLFEHTLHLLTTSQALPGCFIQAKALELTASDLFLFVCADTKGMLYVFLDHMDQDALPPHPGTVHLAHELKGSKKSRRVKLLVRHASANDQIAPITPRSYQIAKCGITALDCVKSEGGCAVAICGLDSGGIVVADFVQEELTGTVALPTKHATAVTGVAILDSTRFLSVGVDQRLFLWSRNVQAWEITTTYLVSVADVSCLIVLGKHCCIAGTGCQILTWSQEANDGKANRN